MMFRVDISVWIEVCRYCLICNRYFHALIIIWPPCSHRCSCESGDRTQCSPGCCKRYVSLQSPIRQCKERAGTSGLSSNTGTPNIASRRFLNRVDGMRNVLSLPLWLSTMLIGRLAWNWMADGIFLHTARNHRKSLLNSSILCCIIYYHYLSRLLADSKLFHV